MIGQSCDILQGKRLDNTWEQEEQEEAVHSSWQPLIRAYQPRGQLVEIQGNEPKSLNPASSFQTGWVPDVVTQGGEVVLLAKMPILQEFWRDLKATILRV